MIAGIGAGMVSLTVGLFAVCLLLDFTFGAYVVCMLLPIGYTMMAAGFQHESASECKVAANVGLLFAAVYAVLVLLVYFAQTTLRFDGLSAQAARILDFKKGGLLFNYDLLGYGMMALSTFFIGLSVKPVHRADKWLKALLLIHGLFFFGCFVLPMTGLWDGMSEGAGRAGTVALLCWCLYFLPIGLLSYRHFHFEKKVRQLKGGKQ
ncbi:MAG: hypothetical protein K2I84_03745 [Bacteroidales bacterium]|nr:hypothetical protein [Bacteroidales bacterium]